MLYPQLLNGSFEGLPRSLREFHSRPGGGRATGTIAVSHQRGWLARIVGFPPPGDRIPLRLEVAADADREVWTRHFGEFVLKTIQRREGDLLVETVGLVHVLFRVSADRTGMRLESQSARWWIFPLPLRIHAEAIGDEASWKIRVTVAHVGSYRGEVVPTL
jgi:hypothetical protein